MAKRFTIIEPGRNGSAKVFDDRFERTVEQGFFLRNDIELISLQLITRVYREEGVNRPDKVCVTAGTRTYEWRVKDGERFVKLINEKRLSL